ncbi:MAG: FkbM family methyltransferase [Arenibacterium sp.]
MQQPAKSRERFLRSRNLKIPIDPAVTSPRLRHLLREGNYELPECEAMFRLVRRDDVVLELGTGIGYMSALISVNKPVRAIHTYEANPELIDYIAKLHAVNDVTNVTVHNKLLGPKASGPVDFFVRKQILSSSLSREQGPETITRVAKIEVEDINYVLERIKPTVLICDIEGAESTLLPAANFKTLRGAVIETHPQWIGASGVRAVFDAMHKAGLTYFAKGSKGKVVAFQDRF